MSQIEQNFRHFLGKHPEIEICYGEGLINRRSLARCLVKEKVADQKQMEAVIAMIRRFPFAPVRQKRSNLFGGIRVSVKDKVLILDFEKDKELFVRLQKLIEHTNYDRGEMLKIVTGSSSIKVFLDEKKEPFLKDIFRNFKLKNRYADISEISIEFPEEAIDTKGVLSTVTSELLMGGIVITELLTATPELLLYVKQEYVLKAYEVLRRLQNEF